MAPNTIPTKICILSDTHAFSYKRPLPDSDILLHCGDISNVGRPEEYARTLELLKQSKAELKLVIAGNHDRSLDAEDRGRYRDGSNEVDNESFTVHERAIAFWKGAEAKNARVTYLEEGLHEFNLITGATFKIYVSPYTPEFCNWAFAYKRNEDRYNPANAIQDGVKSIVETPIPDFPGVDIVMTHGPPLHRLDRTFRGTDVGCEHLLRAVTRAKPRIHCFGHIHEGNGVEKVHWLQKEDGISSVESVVVDQELSKKTFSKEVDISSSSRHPLKYGESTLMVNAAMMQARYTGLNPPWLVRVDLPFVEPDTEMAGT